jgi:hypothetical protein
MVTGGWRGLGRVIDLGAVKFARLQGMGWRSTISGGMMSWWDYDLGEQDDAGLVGFR